MASDQRIDPSDGFPPIADIALGSTRMPVLRAPGGTRRSPADGSEGVEGLEVVVQVTGVGQAVDDRPAHHALLVDDEGAAHRAALVLVEDAVRPRDLAVRP